MRIGAKALIEAFGVFHKEKQRAEFGGLFVLSASISLEQLVNVIVYTLPYSMASLKPVVRGP